MNHFDPSRVDRLRTIPLKTVARELGYRRDRTDRSRWTRRHSVISINGSRFYDHIQGRGGGGAIDLAMHATGCPFREALVLLERIEPECHHGTGHHGPDAGITPAPASGHWQRVQDYLTGERGLDPGLVDYTHRMRLIKADWRVNAVFITRSATAVPTGAELHGTWPDRPFKGMAPGSRKARGGFWIRRDQTGPALLVESAIDALSVLSLPELGHVGCVISTAGVAPRLPPWINHFKPETLLCGYDADEAGDVAAGLLIKSHPEIQRIRPDRAKDWNQVLQQRNGN